MNSKNLIGLASALLLTLGTVPAHAADYAIDTRGAHAFIQFKIAHLGYSWLLGRFDRFSGQFSYDENHPEDAKVKVNIDVGSVDTNHAERDRHLRGRDLLDVNDYPTARFISTSYKYLGNGKGELTGNFTLHGITRPLTISVNQVGHGPDPWGGYRRGFEGHTHFALADFGIMRNLGPAAREVQLYLSIEGIRQ